MPVPGRTYGAGEAHTGAAKGLWRSASSHQINARSCHQHVYRCTHPTLASFNLKHIQKSAVTVHSLCIDGITKSERYCIFSILNGEPKHICGSILKTYLDLDIKGESTVICVCTSIAALIRANNICNYMTSLTIN